MLSMILFCALLTRTVIAQSVTSLFLPSIESQPLVGSVIGSNGSTTTYSIGCPAGTHADECGIDGALTATEGPRTAMIDYIDSADDISAYISCDLAHSAKVTCTSTISGSGAGKYTGTSTTTLTDASKRFLPVNITSVPSTGASASASTASKTEITGASVTQSLISSTGGVGQTAGDTHWVAGGLAAALVVWL